MKLLHVPYKGSGPTAIDLAGGQIDMVFDGVPSLLPFVQNRKVRPIEALSKNHNPILPDLPTLTELRYPAMVVSLWFGLMAPAGMPQPFIVTLNAVLNEVLESPAARKKLEQVRADILPGTPDPFGEYVRKDYERWGRVIERPVSTRASDTAAFPGRGCRRVA